MDDAAARAHAQRVEESLESLERLADPAAREAAMGAVRALVELYGEALARIMGHLGESGALAEAVAADEVIGSLLLVHGLHPLDAASRVRRSVEALGSSLAAHGTRVELVGIDSGVARVVLHAANGGCGSSTETLLREVEEALGRAAPDLERIEVEHREALKLVQISVRPSVAAMAQGG
jgi:Fe-S cluster biogenesis protein NfuA